MNSHQEVTTRAVNYINQIIRCKKWVKMTGNEDLAYIPIEKLHELKFVCGKHFESKDFKKKKTQLKNTAVPSIRLTADPLSDEKLIEFPCHILRESKETKNEGRNTNDAPTNDDLNADNQVQDDHLDTEPNPELEPDPPQFSWQKTTLISLDETHTETENLFSNQSEAVCDVNNTVTIEDDITTDVRTSNTEYCCDGCQQDITGFRYTCVQCDDYDLCGACEAALIHPQHYMLRVPGPRPQREVKLLIKVIRRKLEVLQAELKNDGIARMDWDVVEIKKEEDPFEEVIPEPAEHHSEDTNLVDSADHCEVPDVSHQEDIYDAGEMEQNPDHDYISESEHSDDQSVPNDDKHKEADEQNVQDSDGGDYLNRSVLDAIDHIDISSEESRKRILQDVVDDEKLDLNMRNIKKLHSSPIRTYATLSKRTGLQSKEESRIKTRNLELSCTNDTNDKDFLDDVKQSPRLLSKMTAPKTIDKFSNTELSHSDKEIPVYPAKRKTNVCYDEVFLEKLRQTPGVSKVTAFYEAMGKCTDINTDNFETSKRIKLSGLDTAQLEEVTIQNYSSSRRLPSNALPSDNVDSRRRLVVKLEDISKLRGKKSWASLQK